MDKNLEVEDKRRICPGPNIIDQDWEMMFLVAANRVLRSQFSFNFNKVILHEIEDVYLPSDTASKRLRRDCVDNKVEYSLTEKVRHSKNGSLKVKYDVPVPVTEKQALEILATTQKQLRILKKLRVELTGEYAGHLLTFMIDYIAGLERFDGLYYEVETMANEETAENAKLAVDKFWHAFEKAIAHEAPELVFVAVPDSYRKMGKTIAKERKAANKLKNKSENGKNKETFNE